MDQGTNIREYRERAVGAKEKIRRNFIAKLSTTGFGTWFCSIPAAEAAESTETSA